MRPVRIQLRRTKGFSLQATSREANGLSALSVARPTKWGNPFREGSQPYMSRPVVVFLFETLLLTEISDADVGEQAAAYRRWVNENIAVLRGKNLACFCALPKDGEPDLCHAAVLLEISNGDQRRRAA